MIIFVKFAKWFAKVYKNKKLGYVLMVKMLKNAVFYTKTVVFKAEFF